MAVKSALEAAGVNPDANKGCDGEKKACGEDDTKKAEEAAKSLAEMVKNAVNKAVEPLMEGLKTKAGTDTQGADEESPVVKAYRQIQKGEKTLRDFPLAIQHKLEDLSAVVGVAAIKSMK